MKELKETIKNKYAWADSEILNHGQDYFLTASRIYNNLESENIYPLLTLLGLSAELFLKAFHVDINVKYLEHNNGHRSQIKKTVKTLNNGKDANGKPIHNGHKLEKLLDHYLIHDKELFDYLIKAYNNTNKRCLLKDLSKYSMIFERSRYIFEYDKREYIKDIDIIFKLVKSLYDSINSLYE